MKFPFKAKVKSREWFEQNCILDTDYKIHEVYIYPDGWDECITGGMLEFCNKEIELSFYNDRDRCYIMKDSTYNWYDWMFENFETSIENSDSIIGSFIKYGDTKVNYTITPDQQRKIIETLMTYYEKYCHIGEGIYQDDNSIIYAPKVLSEITDKYINWKEEEIENESNN